MPSITVKRPAAVAVVALSVLLGGLRAEAPSSAYAVELPGGSAGTAAASSGSQAWVASGVSRGAAAEAITRGAGQITNTLATSTPTSQAGRIRPDGRIPVADLLATATPTPRRPLVENPGVILTAVIQPPQGGSGGSPTATASPTAMATATRTPSPMPSPTATRTPTPIPPAPPSSGQCGGNGGNGGAGGAGGGSGNGGTGGAGGAGGDCTIIVNEITQVVQPIVGTVPQPVVVQQPVYVDRVVEREVVVEQQVVVERTVVVEQAPGAQPATADQPLAEQQTIATEAATDPVHMGVPCALPYSTAEGSAPVAEEGAALEAQSLCDVYQTEPVATCATAYYYHEAERVYYCFAPAA